MLATRRWTDVSSGAMLTRPARGGVMAETADMSRYRKGNSHQRPSPEMRMPEVVKMGKGMVARQVRALLCVSHHVARVSSLPSLLRISLTCLY